PPPAIGEAVVEHAHEPIELRRPHDHPGAQPQVERRELQLRAQKLGLVLEQDLPALAGEPADLAPPLGARLVEHGELIDGLQLHFRLGARCRLATAGRSIASSSELYAGGSNSLSKLASAPSAVAIRSTFSNEAVPVFSKRC